MRTDAVVAIIPGPLSARLAQPSLHNVGGAVVGGVLGGLAGNAIARSEDCNRPSDYRQGHDARGASALVIVACTCKKTSGVRTEGDYWGVESYDDFGRDYRHISQNIQRGRENGFYTSSQARGYYQQLQQIRSRADWQQRSGCLIRRIS